MTKKQKTRRLKNDTHAYSISIIRFCKVLNNSYGKLITKLAVMLSCGCSKSSEL